jgi:monovalent cation:proton antiporter-2 (CPA2) family protein
MSGGFFGQAFIYLAAAVIAVPLARRLGLGSALGYLAAGVVIGPHVVGWVGEEGVDVMHFAEYGVVLMLFLIGLELDPRKLWRMRLQILGMGGLQVLVTTLVFTLLGIGLGLDVGVALAAGMVLSLSSTAMVLQTLQEKGWTRTPSGVRSFSVLLFQDIAVIPMLALLPLLAMSGAAGQDAGAALGLPGRPAWAQGLLVIGVIAGMVLAGRYLTRPVFQYVARTRSHELLIATSLLLVVGITLLMNRIGLSPALGAFIAGVVLADSEFRHELESNIEPFKGLLLGLFFISVGASVDLGVVVSAPLTVAGMVALLVLVKFVILYFLGRFFRLPTGDALLFAVALAQGGEFAFLLLSYSVQHGVMDNGLASLLIVAVVLSMALTPLLILLFEHVVRPLLADQYEAEPEAEAMPEESQPVIIAGYGRFGQVVGRLLRASGFEAILLDHSAGQIELSARFGNKVFYGDASRMELLQAAGASNARLLVVAIDDREKSARMVEHVRQSFPHLKVLARAIDRPHAYELHRAGAHFIARETFGSALALGREALTRLGLTSERATRVATAFEQHDTEGMYKLYEVWGDDAAYGFRVRKNMEALQQVLQDDAEHAEWEEPADDNAPSGSV